LSYRFGRLSTVCIEPGYSQRTGIRTRIGCFCKWFIGDRTCLTTTGSVFPFSLGWKPVSIGILIPLNF
jgi:hypothetical protein